jgi:hypothetical protein
MYYVELIVRDDSGHIIDPPWLLVDEKIVKGSPTDNGWIYEVPDPSNPR